MTLSKELETKSAAPLNSQGMKEIRYLLHTIRPKILKSGDYYLTELDFDLTKMLLDEKIKTVIYNTLGVPDISERDYKDSVVIVKIDDTDKQIFESVLEKYK